MSNTKKSLYLEFINASEYINYNDESSQEEVPIKSQLQRLLSNLPDEDQLSGFEGDLRTLEVSMRAMKFESPSMNINVQHIKEDVLTVREKLRAVISNIEQLLRDVSFKNTYNNQHDNLNGRTEEGGVALTALTAKHKSRPFSKEDVKEGAKVELEHTDDIKTATQIAMDHLNENPNYYKILKSVGL